MKSKTNIILIPLFTGVALAGCGAKSVQTCLPTTPSPVADKQIQLTDSSTMTPANFGSGFLDILSRNSTGSEVKKRCTARIQSHGEGVSQVKIWTAQHCLFDAGTIELKNSKYVLQMFFKGGYFPVDVTIDGIDEMASQALLFQPYLQFMPKKHENLWSSALTEESIVPCQTATSQFAEILKEKRKSIACFSKNELRSFVATTHIKTENAARMKAILDSEKKASTDSIAALPESEKKVLELRNNSTLFSEKFKHHRRTFAYWLNPTHCATPKNLLPKDHNGRTQPQELCPYREPILSQIKSSFPDTYQFMSSIAERTVTPEQLTQLHADVFGCQILSLEEVNPATELKTVCDIETLNRLYWNKWVKPGLKTLEMSSLGFNVSQQDFFTILSNTSLIPTASSPETGTRSQLTVVSQELGDVSPESLNSTVILINLDAQKGPLQLEKGDSGTIFSVFGHIPVGTLSTLDGEATSGGTSILPLPEVADDEPQSDAKKTACK